MVPALLLMMGKGLLPRPSWNYADACINLSEYKLSMSTLINNGEGQQKTSESKNSWYSRGHAQSCMFSLVSVGSIFSSYSLENEEGIRKAGVPHRPGVIGGFGKDSHVSSPIFVQA